MVAVEGVLILIVRWVLEFEVGGVPSADESATR